MTGEGEGKEGTFFFFCFRSNFRAITRLETLATQARPAIERRGGTYSSRAHSLAACFAGAVTSKLLYRFSIKVTHKPASTFPMGISNKWNNDIT